MFISNKCLWNSLAKKNPKYFIYSDEGNEISDEAFNASGVRDVQRYIVDDPIFDVKGLDVLEIGCGIGRMTFPLAKEAKFVYGIDISPEMVFQGSIRDDKPNNVFLSETDGKQIPLNSQSVDRVFSFIVFQHMKSKRVVKKNLQEIYRVLRKDGLAKIQVRGRPTKRFKWYTGVHLTEQEARKITSDFDLIKIEGIGEKYMWLWLRKVL